MIASIPGVVDVEILRGARAATGSRPTFLVEVPHGADEAAHFAEVRARLRGRLPEGLEAFFWINTDIGAWGYGRATAERILEANPERSALVVRCLVPRTFIDCNRSEGFVAGDAPGSGLTSAVPAYIRDEQDRALLVELHRTYVRTVRAAYDEVCTGGGLALVPHTYGPRTLGIERVDDDIVKNLHEACDDGREETWPLRPEIDLVTRDETGRALSAEGLEEKLLAAFRTGGFDPRANQTYALTKGGLGYDWSVAYPGRVICLEVRRDLLVSRWRALEPMTVSPAGVARVAKVLAAVLAD